MTKADYSKIWNLLQKDIRGSNSILYFSGKELENEKPEFYFDCCSCNICNLHKTTTKKY